MPWKTAQAQSENAYYPPALTGLRGNHQGSNIAAHTFALDAKPFSFDDLIPKENYDLIIVGAGISGLSAAWLYREKYPNAKILILDNHDDFGGHAKRNEFGNGETFQLSNGGSESLESPHYHFNDNVNSLLKKIGIDYDKFYQYYDQNIYPSMGMQSGVFLDKKNWGETKILKGDIFEDGADFIPTIQNLPLSDSDKQSLSNIFQGEENYLPEVEGDEAIEAYLSKISYEKYLRENVGLSEAAAKLFRGITIDEWGYPYDLYSAWDACKDDYPGFGGLAWSEDDEPEEEEDPYIFIYPDGNATIARLLVKHLIPEVSAAKANQEEIVTAVFDYQQLDKAEHPVRIRLNSTAVNIKNTDDGVNVGYVSHNKQRNLIHAKKVILACNNGIIPAICPETSLEQKNALHQNVKTALLYAKVFVKNWEPFIKLGTDYVYAPTAPYSLIRLNYPINIGNYKTQTDPTKPMVIHMVKSVVPYASGQSLRGADRLGRRQLIYQSYAELEAELLAQLNEFYALADAKPEILAVTINRWAHGYSYEKKHLWDDYDQIDQIIDTARQPIGNIHIANSDSAWTAYIEAAINEAYRTIEEIG
ncbi:NAD(P)/FAD-dependent oxidoreductase [Suttonella ornithocola]|uniref:Protoporphyrinogen oxidase n=1 Tax=Suttonella ornithocola TaxID=279832 RepID=A0A380MSE9_9GAMM|nr:NAD(P)/FAD-dependent oxidoreductase [Suttonella ornithocola]SUO95485.1 protoporphyrinogen oxidase [Suttonella ornithocola]